MNNKLITSFYRDYKKCIKDILETSNLTELTVIKYINLKIAKKIVSNDSFLNENYFDLFETNNNFYFNKNEEKRVNLLISKYNWGIDEKKGYLTMDIIGNVFEKFINQKENGAYYTDKKIIEYIVDRALLSYVSKNLSNNNSIKKEILRDKSVYEKGFLNFLKKFLSCHSKNDDDFLELINIMLSTKFADISVGTGGFLVELINYVFNIFDLLNVKGYKSIEDILRIIVNNTYGFDIMPEAVELAKLRMTFVILKVYKMNKVKTDSIPNLNIMVMNTLKKVNWNDIISNKFDIIIGNPPYIEKKNIDYTVDVAKTINTGNTYSFMIEKSLDLLNEKGVLGVIVPISIVSTMRMASLRQLLMLKSQKIFFANFSDRPMSLFKGVHQKLSIVIADLGKKKCNIYTTRYYHWNSSEEVLKKISYVKVNDKLIEDDYIPKLGNKCEENIYRKIVNNRNSLLSLIQEKPKKNEISLFDEELSINYTSSRLTFWIKSFNKKMESNEYKKYYFQNKVIRDLFYLILNSDIFYFMWECISDGWHLTNKELSKVRFNLDAISDEDKCLIHYYTNKLQNDIERNKVIVDSKQTKYEIKTKKSKKIIDEIDYYLSKFFLLTKKEIEYLINYNIRYRMNDEYEKYKEIS